MKRCRCCDAELAGRHQRLYCSSACQQRYRQLQLTSHRLATGEGEPRGERSNYIRLFLSEEQRSRCAICGLTAEWQGAPLAFVLDHVDGDASHNRRENLRLICPNCDSQLPTYKSRNRGRGRAWRTLRRANGKSY